jgi:hypothetical protein
MSLLPIFPGGNRSSTLSETQDLVDALAPVVSALQKLGIRYFVAGSVASSFHGAVRSTMDVDIVCELGDDQVSLFLKSLAGNYYGNEAALRDAVQRKSCFNLIHLPSSFKVDIFVSRGRPFDIDSMNRATLETIGDDPVLNVTIATAEDSIIAKLEWYKLGNQVSERQWDDVSRLMDLLGEQADIDYLQRAAQSVEVDELLTRLLEEKRHE